MTGLFLEPSPGRASLNLIKMARPSLVFELRNAIHKAQKSDEPVRKSGLEVKIKDRTHYVAIEAVPLDASREERLFLIIFQEVESPMVPTTRSADARNRRIRELEAELASLREDMRSIIEEQEASNEELQSANEEIISSNEELQSINEELETSKEEIESTNEELLTINQELHVRNDQLSEAYQFAEDIFGTIREATLVLDTDLRVKSANQAFYQLFKLNEDSTERRLIYELGNRQWDIPELRLMLTDIVTSDAQFMGFELTYSSLEVGEKILSLNARRVVRQNESILLAIEDITEHRRAQLLLAEREAWFRQIANNAPTLIWMTDAKGKFTYLNKVWLEYTGQTMEVALRQGIMQALHPADRDGYQTNYDENIRKRVRFQSEYRLRRYDGNYRWMLENAQPIFDAEGSFNGYIGSSVDVNLQKEATQELDQRVRERTAELEQTSTQLRTLVENTPDVITRWNVDLKLLFANSAFVRKMGKPLNELLDKTTAEIGQPDEIAQPYMDVLQKTFETRYPQEHLHEYPTPEGTALFYSRIVPEFGPDGIVRSVLAIARDITDLQEAKEQARENTLNLQAVLNSSRVAIGFLKPVLEKDAVTDFRLVVCNQEFATMADQTIEQLTGQLLSHLADKLWQEHTIRNVLRTLETGEPFRDERLDLNSNQWMLITLNKYDGGVVLTGENITALKQAERRIDGLFDELEKSNEQVEILTDLRQQIRERGEFLRRTSHDLRGNFGIIQGAATLLDMASTEEERAQMQSMLQRNLQQATKMLTELLDVARLEAGQEERQITSFDAAELLNGMIDSVRPLADERGLWLRAEGADTLLTQGDAIKVHRIAQNLLLNAIKYTQQGGVTLNWSIADDTHWQLTVVDTGPGLVNESGSRSGEGIGLLIVRQLGELLGCQVDMNSQPGVGTQFRLLFPRVYPDGPLGE